MRPGGVGLLGIGPVLVAVAALLLAWRKRLVLALVMGSGVFLLAAFTLQYAPAPHDVTRFDGHARNFALLALLISLASRLPSLRPRWRYTAAAITFALVTWPTVVEPARGIALALSRGIQLANTQSEQGEVAALLRGRHALSPLNSEHVAAYIRNHTLVDSRVLSPDPAEMSIATGRPNAAGFADSINLRGVPGPEYEDAIGYLEPVAVRRLGFAYVHSTDAWVASLPDRAQQWLMNPQLFKLLVRDGTDALYRIQPAFLRLNATPAPESFEALRQVVPASASAYFAGGLTARNQVRTASALAHTRLLGEVDPSGTHLLTDIPTEPVGGQFPDVLLVPRGFSFTTKAEEFSLIWWNDEIAAYATAPGIQPVVDQPPPPTHNFSVRLTDVRMADDRVAFTATFADQAPELWTGQDWLVIEVDDTPWALPTGYEVDGFTNVGALWFAGQLVPTGETTTHRYEFNARATRLAVQDGDGMHAARTSSGEGLAPGTYVLAVRLRLEHLQAAVIPVLRVTVSEAGGVAYRPLRGRTQCRC